MTFLYVLVGIAMILALMDDKKNEKALDDLWDDLDKDNANWSEPPENDK